MMRFARTTLSILLLLAGTAVFLMAAAVSPTPDTAVHPADRTETHARYVAPHSVAVGPPKTGEELFREACATCHGPDGTGAPKTQVGFDAPLPDFTSCNFASREPNGDWIAVAHEGGPVRGFSKRMPAFGDALTQAQLEKNNGLHSISLRR